MENLRTTEPGVNELWGIKITAVTREGCLEVQCRGRHYRFVLFKKALPSPAGLLEAK